MYPTDWRLKCPERRHCPGDEGIAHPTWRRTLGRQRRGVRPIHETRKIGGAERQQRSAREGKPHQPREPARAPLDGAIRFGLSSGSLPRFCSPGTGTKRHGPSPSLDRRESSMDGLILPPPCFELAPHPLAKRQERPQRPRAGRDPSRHRQSRAIPLRLQEGRLRA